MKYEQIGLNDMRNTIYILLIFLYSISCLQAGGGNGRRISKEEKPEVFIMKQLGPNPQQEEDLTEKEVRQMIADTIYFNSTMDRRMEAGRKNGLW
jgi:hypothetical protein